MNEMMSFKTALDSIKSMEIKTKSMEKIFLNESIGRVLFSDIRARLDNPHFKTANMDGYALDSSDLNDLKKTGLKIAAINKAGGANCAIKKGFCIKTFTGAKMPENADCLVIIEDVEIKNNKIFLKKDASVKINANIRQIGENYKKNSILLPKNHLISALDMGILAQNHNILLEVYKKPKIAILSFGDELCELGEIKNLNAIFSSNNHILGALARNLGAEISLFPAIIDDKKNIYNALDSALNDSDIVLTTGGMSKGDFDFTKDIVGEFGKIIFSGVKMKPGKVIRLIACKEKFRDKFILALPGNPLACVVGFLIFGRILMQKILGLTPNQPILKAILKNDIKKSDDRFELILADVVIENGNFCAIGREKSSYMINDLRGAFILSDKDLQKGASVDIILLQDLLTLGGFE